MQAAPPRAFARLAAWCACIAVSSALSGDVVVAQRAQPPFAACEPRAGDAWTYDRLMCLRRVGLEHGARNEARRRLRQLGAEAGSNPWVTLVLAHVTLDELQRQQAIALYEAAAEAFARSQEAEGEVIARQNAATQYRLRGDVAAAARHVQRAVAAAETSKSPLTIARAAAIEAVHAISTGGDIGRAHRVLTRADRLTPPDAPIGLRRTILLNLATADMHLGRFDAAIDVLERHRALMSEDRSTQDAGTVAYNLLGARIAQGEIRPREGLRAALVAEAETVLAQARELRDPLTQAMTHQFLGDLLRASDPDLAAAHLRSCLDGDLSRSFPSVRATCMWSLSRQESVRDPARAERLSREAVALARGSGDGVLLAWAWQARMPLAWRTLPEDAAIGQSFEALEAIERIRAGQRSQQSRAALLSQWARLFQWLTGRLLQSQPPRVAQAFEVGERLRSRVLLEYLAQAGVRGAAPPPALTADPRVSEPIARTQRRLLEPSLRDDQRRLLLGQLQLLELEQEEQEAGRIPPLSSSVVPFASLDAVQRELKSHEALVWFSIAPWTDLYEDFGGGSWVVVVTPGHADAHPIMPSVDLDGQIAAFNGLLRERGSGADAWTPAARRLGTTLLGNALDRLPADISRLVIVSDGRLHQVPFEALSLGTGPLLGERFDISTVPSATLWLRLRQARVPHASRGALVLANPALPAATMDGVTLRPLPEAGREARSIASLLGLETRDVLQGRDASERVFKQAPFDSFGIVHLAAHARADAAFPERSAVFLSPGHDEEDGWLQPPEISALNLAGALVVLSACESADGSLLSGEGPLSLARAFFAGGAASVVATRWAIRDDDAAFLMERFYRALASGAAVDAALRQSRRDAMAEGLPAAAWAGIASLGDGGRRPLTPRTPGAASWLWLAAPVAALLALTGAAHLLRRTTRAR
jgi:tetratricopeptide (TPR) repeat protein